MSGGMDVLRQAMHTWAVRTNTAGYARDMGLASTSLDEFAAGTTDLNPDALNKLANLIFQGFCTYDPQTDSLVKGNQAEPLAFAPAGMTPEYEMRPQLNKDERRPKKGPTLDKPAGWRPELDKLWRHKSELRGPLG